MLVYVRALEKRNVTPARDACYSKSGLQCDTASVCMGKNLRGDTRL